MKIFARKDHQDLTYTSGWVVGHSVQQRGHDVPHVDVLAGGEAVVVLPDLLEQEYEVLANQR